MIRSIRGHIAVPILSACILTVAMSVAAPAAVLVTDSDLAAARARIEAEPLRSYAAGLTDRPTGPAAPILYLLTGDVRFARLARKTADEDIAFLRQWMPYMVDIWILRSPGRVVSALLAYDMTRTSGVWTEQDITDLHEYLGHVVDHYMNECGDHLAAGAFPYQTDFIPADMDIWIIANMNVHRVLAVGLYGLVFPEDARSERLLDYAEGYVESILSLGARPGGAWAENPRYAGGVLQELYLLATGLKNAGRRDFFADERFRAMLGFFAESIPVPGIEHPDKPTMLAADDSNWWENHGDILAWAAPRFSREDPKTASEWMWCWRALGSPLTPESLLFADPGIAPRRPDYGSYLPGMGYVIGRHRFAEPDETFFFATFGPEFGTSNKTMHHQPNHGDFSFIWRGLPIMLTQGVSSYIWSRRMRDQVPFSKSVVTYDGAGESLEIPEIRYSGPATEAACDRTIDESLARDYYPDGVSDFVTTPAWDYAAGHVYNWEIGLPAAFNRRHFLFLKPDVLVVWDQVRSAYPLQWNLHLPADRVAISPNRLDLRTPDGVDLAVDILRDKPADVTLDWPLESIRADWPLVLSSPYGDGLFVFNALDIARQVLDNNIEGAIRIYRNIIEYPARPQRIGVIESDGQTAAVLDRLGYTYDLLSYKDLAGDLSRYDRIVFGHFAVLVRDRDLIEYRQKLWDYVAAGGVLLWQYEYAWGWLGGDTWGPGYFPHPLMVGEGTSVVWGEGIELHRDVRMEDNLIWREPFDITPEDWLGWQVGPPDSFKVMPVYPQLPNTDRARNIPVWYSDAWRVHATARRTYNITPPSTRDRFGPYRWIKVHNPPSEDYVTVFRPSKDGTPAAPARVTGGRTSFTVATGGETWWTLIGSHPGITATLTLLRYPAGTAPAAAVPSDTFRRDTMPLEALLVEAREAEIGGMRFRFGAPATLSFDTSSAAGKLKSLDGCRAAFPAFVDRVTLDGAPVTISAADGLTAFDLPPGEYTFTFRDGLLALARTSHVARIEVRDADGEPVQWVHILRRLPGGERTWFQGATDKDGTLSIRWTGKEKQRIILKGEGMKEVEREVVPGVNGIVLED